MSKKLAAFLGEGATFQVVTESVNESAALSAKEMAQLLTRSIQAHWQKPGGLALHAWITNLTRDAWSVLVAVGNDENGVEVWNSRDGWLYD